MGWRPDDVRACSICDFETAVDGYIEANSVSDETDSMTRDDLNDLMKEFPD